MTAFLRIPLATLGLLLAACTNSSAPAVHKGYDVTTQASPDPDGDVDGSIEYDFNPPLSDATRTAVAEWAARLRDTADDGIVYPTAATIDHGQGVAIVKMVVLADGTMTECGLERSSGNSILDHVTTTGVCAVRPEPPPGREIRRVTLHLPFGFKLFQH